jgi:hypothetical protein
VEPAERTRARCGHPRDAGTLNPGRRPNLYFGSQRSRTARCVHAVWWVRGRDLGHLAGSRPATSPRTGIPGHGCFSALFAVDVMTCPSSCEAVRDTRVAPAAPRSLGLSALARRRPGWFSTRSPGSRHPRPAAGKTCPLQPNSHDHPRRCTPPAQLARRLGEVFARKLAWQARSSPSR